MLLDTDTVSGEDERMQLPDLKTTTEAASRLDCTPRYIAKLVKLDKLKPIKKLPGRTGAYLFDAAELDRYAAGAAA